MQRIENQVRQLVCSQARARALLHEFSIGAFGLILFFHKVGSKSGFFKGPYLDPDFLRRSVHSDSISLASVFFVLYQMNLVLMGWVDSIQFFYLNGPVYFITLDLDSAFSAVYNKQT